MNATPENATTGNATTENATTGSATTGSETTEGPNVQATTRAASGSRLRTLRQHWQWHGTWAAAVLLVMQPLRRLRLLRIGEVTLGSTAPRGSLPETAVRVDARFLTDDEVRDLAQRGQDWFFPAAVAGSLQRGARCFALLEEGVVVTSRWYASGPLRQFGVELQAPSDCLFVHRVFTAASMRGRGMAALVSTLVRSLLREEGIAWIIGTIDLTNAASRTAFRKAGAVRVGWMVQFGPDRWRCGFLVRTDPRCPTVYHQP